MRILATAFTLALLAACTKPADTTDSRPAPRRESASSKSKVIAKGIAYKEAEYKIPGKIVLLDFYADW